MRRRQTIQNTIKVLSYTHYTCVHKFNTIRYSHTYSIQRRYIGFLFRSVLTKSILIKTRFNYN